MYMTRQNGVFAAILHTRDELIKYHKMGFIIYEPLFNSYGAMIVPVKSEAIKMFNEGKFIEMKFINGIPII